MNRILVVSLIFLIGATFTFNNRVNETKNNTTIPQDAIRLRIKANSNSDIDQNVKLEIKDEVNEYMTEILMDVEDYEEAKKIIYDNLDEIKIIVNERLLSEGLTYDNYVDYGQTYFPAKAYNGYIYPAGEYEAVYIELGDGSGDNWWCVLFPPLCLVNGAVDIEESNDEVNNEIEYKFLIVEYIKSKINNK